MWNRTITSITHVWPTAIVKQLDSFQLCWSSSLVANALAPLALLFRFEVDGDVDVEGDGEWGKSFWDRGDFPQTAINGTSGIDVVVQDIWSEGSDVVPFYQSAYLTTSHLLLPLISPYKVDGD